MDYVKDGTLTIQARTIKEVNSIDRVVVYADGCQREYLMPLPMGEITWEEAFKTLLVHIGIYDLGKKRWFDEENGLWYDRKEHEYITLAEVIDRAMDVIKIEW